MYTSGTHTKEPEKILPIRPLIPEEDGGNFNYVGVMVGNKNNAVPSNAFPVPPLPLSAFERNHIPTERIIAHLS
jgi:hypothetical protein